VWIFQFDLTFPEVVVTKTKKLLFSNDEQECLGHCSTFPYQIGPSHVCLTALCSR